MAISETMGPHVKNVARAEAYLQAKFHFDPSNCLATIHQRYRQDRQRSDSIGRTVLQTIAQKYNGLPYSIGGGGIKT